jgi:hypothetical protein
MSKDSAELPAQLIKGLLDPIRRATSSNQERRRLLETLGWNVAATPEIESSGLVTISWIVEKVDVVLPLFERLPNLSAQELATLFSSATDLSHTLLDAGDSLAALGTEFEEFGRELFNALAVGYLRYEHPPIAALGTLLTLIRDSKHEPIIRASGEVVRHARIGSVLQLDRIPRLLSEPTLLQHEYFPEALSAANVQDVSDRLLSRVAGLLSSLGCRISYGLDSSLRVDFGELGGRAASRTLCFVAHSDVLPIYFGATLSFRQRRTLGS